MPSNGKLIGVESGLNYWPIPNNLYKGQDVFVLGGGPSISHIAANKKVLQGKNVIAVHYAILAYPMASIWFIGDSRCYWELCQKVDTDNNMLVTMNIRTSIVASLEDVPHMNIIRCKKGRGLSTSSKDCIYYNGSGGGAAIDLAFRLGAARIILYGFDGGTLPSDSNNQFSSPHTKQNIVDTWRGDVKTWAAIDSDAYEKGIDILNCTPNTELPIIRKRILEDYI